MAGSPIGGAVRQIHHLFAEGTAAGLADGQLLERFLTRGDEAAFAALVQRHGPMVLGVCRSVLRNPADAEDAFQATFLVLVCKGRSIRGKESLGGWLRQVAHRIAVQAGADAIRRRARELRVGANRREDRCNDDEPDDWRQALHEELATLSEKHRLPLLLCDLEGKTHTEAAAELGCGPATVQRRLNGGRALLRSRLIRRGIAPTAGGLAATLGRSASAQVPPAWVEAAVRAAGSWARGAGRLAVGDATSAAAATLAGKSLRAMTLGQLKVGAAAAVILVAVVGIAGLAAQDRAGSARAPRMAKAQAAPARSPEPDRPAGPGETVIYQGRVLDPDRKPLPGAALDLMNEQLEHPVRATTGADGRFRIEVPKSDFDRSFENEPWTHGTLVARAPGLGFGLANVGQDSGELTLRLVRDDVPISGRIIDLQGRPVAGAVVTVLGVGASPDGRLDAYLKAVQERNELGELDSTFFPLRLDGQPEPPVVPPARTGADGRFRLAGIGRERVASLQIEGPAIATGIALARTRPGPTWRLPERKGDEEMDPEDRPERVSFYGATFDHVAGPTRPIEGGVRDLETGRPLAGIMVHGDDTPAAGPAENVRAITDAQGRYRLVGLPKGREGHVVAVPPCDFPYPYHGRRKAELKLPPDESLPYLRTRVPVGKADGPGPLHLDIKLKRGVWVTGRVLDRDTRKPVAGTVEYFVFVDNPQVERYPGFARTRMRSHHPAGIDGVFHLVAIPGPGLLTARVHGSQYIRAAGAEALGDRVKNGLIETYPYYAAPSDANVIDLIDPAPDSGSMSHDLLLETGRTLPVTVLGPDGRPLIPTELVTVGLKDMSWWQKVPPGTSDLKIVALAPGRARIIEIRHEAKRLIGELTLRGDETRPQTMILRPWGVVTGRAVDADGQPIGGVQIHPVAGPSGYPEIGKGGRFRVEGLVPGKSYDLQILKPPGFNQGFIATGLSIGPGETRDLGDVTPR